MEQARATRKRIFRTSMALRNRPLPKYELCHRITGALVSGGGYAGAGGAYTGAGGAAGGT